MLLRTDALLGRRVSSNDARFRNQVMCLQGKKGDLPCQFSLHSDIYVGSHFGSFFGSTFGVLSGEKVGGVQGPAESSKH